MEISMEERVEMAKAPFNETEYKDEDFKNSYIYDKNQIKLPCDIAIAFPHWGGQYNSKPNEEQLRIGKELSDKGFIVIGSGPHTPHEVYFKGSKFIGYSLGDFLSAHDKPDTTNDGKILTLKFIDNIINSYKEYNTTTITDENGSTINIKL